MDLSQMQGKTISLSFEHTFNNRLDLLLSIGVPKLCKHDSARNVRPIARSTFSSADSTFVNAGIITARDVACARWTSKSILRLRWDEHARCRNKLALELEDLAIRNQGELRYMPLVVKSLYPKMIEIRRA